MALTLHELTHSPFCIPVRRILDAHRIPYQRIEVPNWDRRSVALLTGGRYYQVPVLDHDGTIVHETPADPLAVPHYLDRTFTAGALFPDHCTGIHEIVVHHIEDALEGIGFRLCDPAYLDAIQDPGERAMIIRHKERKFGPGCVDQWRRDAADLAARFESALLPFESRLAHHPFLFGVQPVYADYALLGVLDNARFSGTYTLPPRFPHLQRWEAVLASWPAP